MKLQLRPLILTPRNTGMQTMTVQQIAEAMAPGGATPARPDSFALKVGSLLESEARQATAERKAPVK